jgi:hypothetical protein
MVNFASRIHDEKPSILLSLSKKIRKPSSSPSQTPSAYPPPYLPTPSSIPPLISSPLSTHQSLLSYDPYQNLVLCPRGVQEILTSKENKTYMEVIRMVGSLKVPENHRNFQKHMGRIRTLVRNQEALAQNRLLESYKEAERPKEEVLRMYYEYVKARLEMEKRIEEENRKKDEEREEEEGWKEEGKTIEWANFLMDLQR